MLTSRRAFLQGVTAAALDGQQLARRPNVILILSDDQGYGDLSCHGNTLLKTPNLDRLALQGVECTRFYVEPVCAPTRSSLLTGRYNLRCGVHGVTRGLETMRASETTLAEAFHAGGYRTALFGKWHLGEAFPNVPHAQGFDEFIGFRTGHWIDYYDSQLERNGKPFPVRGYISDALTREGLRFMRENADHPFLLYMAYNQPHRPDQVPDKYFASYKAMGLDDDLAAIYGMVAKIDENIGQLMDRAPENTIVIFMSDNGPNGERYNCGLRGRKGSVYEGGVRAPFFIRWPGHLAAGRKVDRIAAHIDVYPTLLDLCGVPQPTGPPIDGRSMAPLLRDANAAWPERMLFTHRDRGLLPDAADPGTVRTQRFNLVNRTELYDLQEDPGEKRNAAADYPDRFKDLRAAYDAWYRSVTAGQTFERLPLPVGYEEENPVVLPATQAYMTGTHLRYWGDAGFAHDWITGWSDASESVYWEIDVHRTGHYEVTLRYLCPPDSTGARIQVTAAGAALEGQIVKATSMEPKRHRDLLARTEVAEMPWGELRLGVMAIEAGRTRLILKALSKPGSVVMDLKDARLRWVAK